MVVATTRRNKMCPHQQSLHHNNNDDDCNIRQHCTTKTHIVSSSFGARSRSFFRRSLVVLLLFLIILIATNDSVSTIIIMIVPVRAFVVVGVPRDRCTTSRRCTFLHIINNNNNKKKKKLKDDTEATDHGIPVIENKHNNTFVPMDAHRRSMIMASTIGVSTILYATGIPTKNPALAVEPAALPWLIPNPPARNDHLYEWPLGKVAFSLLPIAGTYTRRVTVEQEVVPHTIWTHDQIQGIVNVNVPIRQTVVRLFGTNDNHYDSDSSSSNNHNNGGGGGGLWVHNPVAPTKQLLQMMDRLIQQYGPVRHIVLGTVALEHKATLAAFASHYPRATVWIQPGQWSFPVNLPIEYYGLQQQLLAHRLLELPNLRTHPVTTTTTTTTTSSLSVSTKLTTTTTTKYKKRPPKYSTSTDPIVPEWYNEIEYEMLGPFTFKAVGGYSESAFYHKPTSTLIVTDCVVSVTKDPPQIIQEDPRALIYHSRDSADEQIIDDTMERRQKGWRRMVQFGLVFFPSQISVTPTIGKVLDDIQRVPYKLRNLGTDAIPFNSALYPWSWNANDADQINFDTISQNGTLFCPPILTKLILDREPTATLQFVDRVCQRFSTMKRIIPCHLNNDIAVTDTNEFYHAFDMLRSPSTQAKSNSNLLLPQPRALAEDLALLQKASDVLTQNNIIAPSLVCDGEPARQVGRFAASKMTRLPQQ